MKDLIKIIILIIIFIGSIFLIKNILDYDTMKKISTSNTLNESKSEEKNMDSNVLEITKDNFQKEVLEESKTVLVDFYAEWCEPCKMLSPIIDEVAKNNQDVKFVRVNVDDVEDIAIKYEVYSIPTLIVIKDGEEKDRQVGLVSQSKVEELIK